MSAEERALVVLRKAGAHDVHVHVIHTEWGRKDGPP